MAVLKEVGKVPSESDRLIKVVIGDSRESIHDFRSFVGMRSREHVEFEDERIALRTSRVVAGKKSERVGGGKRGGGLRLLIKRGVRGVKRAQRFVILSSKNCRKAEARDEGQVEFGRDGGGLRQRRLSRVFHNFRGCWLQVAIKLRK